jgi:flagellar hook-basal body protein
MMSLYGALFGGVSGMRAQSGKMGVISDNIANVNTVGYKQGQATFKTLVVNADSSVSYNTGGVNGGVRLNVDKQGLLQSTDSPTDVAISGKGFFVVKTTSGTTTTGTGTGTGTGTAGATADTDNTPLFTRAGSFRQDATGNFVNSQGFYLQGWPLDRNGLLPGAPGNVNTISAANFDSLENVNVQSVSGTSRATSTVTLSANLNAGEKVFPGSKVTLSPDVITPNNANLTSTDILVGAEFGMATADSLVRGDRFTIATGSGLSYSYEYGGYTTGRKVTISGGAANAGDNGINNTALVNLNTAASIVTSPAPFTSSFDLTIPNHGLITGDKVVLSGFAAAIGATPAGQLNATQTVTYVNANTVRITVATAHGIPASTNVGPGGVTANPRQYIGNIFDAQTSGQAFLAQIGTVDFTPASLTFGISSPSSGAVTFKYVVGSPNALAGEFNSLTSLATAIDKVTGLTARVVDGRLVVASENASEQVVFTNGDTAGTPTSTPPKRGLNWISELGLSNVATGNRRFASLDGLSKMVTTDAGITAVVNNPLSSATLDINLDDPLDTVTFADLPNVASSIPTVGTPITIPAAAAGNTVDIVVNTPPPAYMVVGDNVTIQGQTAGIGGLPGTLPNGGPFSVIATTAGSYTFRIPATQITAAVAGGTANGTAAGLVFVVGKTNHGSPLAALGIVTSLNGAAYTPQTKGVLGPLYDASGAIGKNMASGNVTPQFSRNVRIYDALGAGHDLRFSYIKIATNKWAVEVHAIPATDVTTTLVNGQVAVGTIEFNGDGSLRTVSPTLITPLNINWTNGAVPSTVTLNLGTAGQPFGTVGATVIGLTDGLSQFNAAYNVNFAKQNGAPIGQLTGVSITKDGIVVASYSNGETQNLFKLPLADFPNPDGLTARTGNVYAQSNDSGEVNLREASTNGVGSVVASSLEQSNVDLAEQLTDMIVAQRAYQANTKVIKTSDELLDQLNQI